MGHAQGSNSLVPSHPIRLQSSAVKHPQIVPPIYMSEEEPRNAMEGRARRRASPGTRSKAAVRPVQAEMPPPTKTHVPGTRVPVVYYLCRNRQLEHPHFMEVPLASPQGLYLRDVVSRLDALRGKGMAAMYSWSYKRSYKNGFVWHDLSEDDLLLPAQGSEYVLKGSELLDQPPPASDHQQNTSINNAKVQCPKPRSSSSSPPPPAAAAVSVIKEEAPQPQQQPALPSSPSSSTLGDDEQCRTPQSGSSGSSSPKTTRGSMSSSGASSPSLTAHNVRSPVAAHDVGTQIDEKGRDLQNNDTTTCTDNEVKLQQGRDAASTQQASPTKRKGPEIVEEEDPPAGAGSGGSCSSGRDRSGTLESLIREEAGRRGGARILEEEDDEVHKLKPGNLLMRLIACGSMSVKNHPGFGLVQTYKPRFTQLEFPSSPVLSPLGALRHPDHSPWSPPTNTGAVRVSETERSSGSLHGTAGTGKQEESGKGTTPNLKRSSSYNQDGVSEEECSKGGSVRLASIKCCPEAAIKMAPCEQPRSGSTLVSTTADASHNSGEQQECSSGPSPQTLSRRTNKRTSDPSSGKIRSSRVVTFHDEKEKVIKIEERLSSGARVVIQCAPLL